MKTLLFSDSFDLFFLFSLKSNKRNTKEQKKTSPRFKSAMQKPRSRSFSKDSFFSCVQNDFHNFEVIKCMTAAALVGRRNVSNTCES